MSRAPWRGFNWSLAALSPAYLAALVAFGWACSQFYLPGQGFTYLIDFGDRADTSILPELSAVNHFVDHNTWGYDAQYYAQIAMRPHLDDPVLRRAMDNLAYRARRILFCWTAYALAGGNPVWALHIYSVQNIAAWFLLAFLLLRWFPPVSWGNWARWAGILFSFGLCVSVRKSLADGPSPLLIAAGMALLESRRPWLAAAVFGVSGLGKEPNIFCAASLAPAKNSVPGWGRGVGQAILVVLPLAVWTGILSHRLADSGALGARNFTVPFQGYFAKWGEIAHAVATTPGWIVRGNLYVIVALTVQWIFLVVRPRWTDPWWRLGAAYAFLMILLGGAVWEGYPGAAARVLLPMTLAFNILVPRGRAWWIVLLLGNLTVLATPGALKPPPRESQVVEGPRALRIDADSGQAVKAVYDSSWYPPERSWLEFWLWNKGSAGLSLRNPHSFPMEANISFDLRSNDRRFVRLIQGGSVIWQGSLEPRTPLPVKVPALLLSPGDTRWQFETGPAVRSGNTDDARLLGFSLRKLTIDLTGRPAN